MEMENTVRVEIFSRDAHRPQLAHEEHSKERESLNNRNTGSYLDK